MPDQDLYEPTRATRTRTVHWYDDKYEHTSTLYEVYYRGEHLSRKGEFNGSYETWRVVDLETYLKQIEANRLYESQEASQEPYSNSSGKSTGHVSIYSVEASRRMKEEARQAREARHQARKDRHQARRDVSTLDYFKKTWNKSKDDASGKTLREYLRGDPGIGFVTLPLLPVAGVIYSGAKALESVGHLTIAADNARLGLASSKQLGNSKIAIRSAFSPLARTLLFPVAALAVAGKAAKNAVTGGHAERVQAGRSSITVSI